MGSVLLKSAAGTEAPTIGLLNIGEEEVKGNDIIKKAAELLIQVDSIIMVLLKETTFLKALLT